MDETVFPKIRARSLFFFIISSIILTGVTQFIVEKIFPEWSTDPLSGDLISLIIFELSLISWLVWLFRRYRISFIKLVRFKIPRLQIWIQGIMMLGVSLLFSLGAYSVIYFLLSYLFPDFVLSIINEEIFSSNASSSLLLVFNLFQLIAAVILAPILEELIFRGILLHRWSTKWNITRGLVLSAIVFGAVHIDFLGSFIFALIMGIFYLKTKTLVLPMVLHFINNLIAFTMTSQSLSHPEPTQNLTLPDFREGITFGLIALLITTPILIWFLKKNWPKNELPLPYSVS